MFEFVRRHTRLMQFVLLLLIFPAFVFFGIEGYSGFNAGSVSVAEVAGRNITQAEWDAAHRNLTERLRAAQPEADLKLYDSPEFKQRSLDALVRERVLLTAADKLHLNVPDARLQRLFASDPQYAFLRTPDGALNKALLESRGLSTAQFETQLRQDYGMRQVLEGIDGSALASARAAEAALDALYQKREVHIARFQTESYRDKVKPTDAEIEAWYKEPAHAAGFEQAERVAIEYVLLDLDALKPGITVGDEELRQFYDQNASRYGSPAERRASHILVKAESGASAAQRAAAKTKAEGLLVEAKKDPSKFAELAKKHSDDPGSAANGGDLDYFGRGAMVKPFEDAAFALKPGELSGVVESDFGYHVIRLTAVRGGEKKPFEAVRAEIENEVKGQLAQRRYAEAAETFSNLVYEQADSLKPVADKLGLKLRAATEVARAPRPDAEGPLASPKFIAALFTDDVLRNKRNSEAVELGANQLAAARVTAYAPARRPPLDEVKAAVRERVVAEQAAALARKEGTDKLAAWRGGAAPQGLEGPLVISRVDVQTYPRVLVESVLKALPAPLPAWVGVDFGAQGYAVVRVDKLLPRDPAADAKQLQAQYAQLWGDAEAEAYYQALRARYKVQVTGVAKPAEAAAR